MRSGAVCHRVRLLRTSTIRCTHPGFARHPGRCPDSTRACARARARTAGPRRAVLDEPPRPLGRLRDADPGVGRRRRAPNGPRAACSAKGGASSGRPSCCGRRRPAPCASRPGPAAPVALRHGPRRRAAMRSRPRLRHERAHEHRRTVPVARQTRFEASSGCRTSGTRRRGRAGPNMRGVARRRARPSVRRGIVAARRPRPRRCARRRRPRAASNPPGRGRRRPAAGSGTPAGPPGQRTRTPTDTTREPASRRPSGPRSLRVHTTRPGATPGRRARGPAPDGYQALRPSSAEVGDPDGLAHPGAPRSAAGRRSACRPPRCAAAPPAPRRRSGPSGR